MTEDTELKKMIEEEGKIKDIVKKRISALHSYGESNTEILSYRLAEILISAKNLYTKDLMDLVKKDISDEQEVWNSIMGMRMTMLHLKDCVEEFDMMMLELMDDKEEVKGEQ